MIDLNEKQKVYFQKFLNKLYENRFSFILLSFAFVFILVWSICVSTKYLIILLFLFCCFIYIIQSLCLIKRNIVTYTFSAFFLILLYFELIFCVLNYSPGSSITGYYDYVTKDSIVGWRFMPNCHKVRSTKIINKDTVYDVYYSSDDYSRRINDDKRIFDNKGPVSAKKHAIFLGCSFTFGQGLDYTSTFPYLFEQENPEFISYNYGFSNYAPQEFCLFFDNGINTINNTSIPEDEGFCFYSFIDDHLNRVYGGSSYLSNANTNDSPEVSVIENQLFFQKRSFFKKLISWILNNSETLKYFGISITYPKTEAFYLRFAEIINYTAYKYWDLKPNGNFYVSLYPHKYCVSDTSWVKFLDKRIIVLKTNFPDDFDTNSLYLIKDDGHPDKELNMFYAKEISKSINKN